MSKRAVYKFILALAAILTVAMVAVYFFVPSAREDADPEPQASSDASLDSAAIVEQEPGPALPAGIPTPEEAFPEEIVEPEEDEDEPEEEEDAPPAIPDFEPYPLEETLPEIMLASEAVMSGGRIVESFSFEDRIDFGRGDTYSLIDGVTTFRGNNFRDTAAFGFADISNAKFGDKWFMGTASYTAPDGAFWSGHGWTGQPLIVCWPKETREVMNMHSWAREQEELVEVVYAAMDCYVYFAELETGRATRDRLYIGMPFKGSGALDPRGYPLLYVGAGYHGQLGNARIFVISLIDGSVLYTFGMGDGFAPRNWTAADAAPLVDAEFDRLIYPSENGVVYIIPLNSEFDPEAGTMTIDPSEPVKWRFTGRRSHVGGKYWLGFESSPVIWRGHAFLTDNGGHLICLDLNTLEAVWVQDVLDDTNCTPVLELEDGHPYLYLSTSFHGGWRASMDSSAPVPMWKIDAVTGEVVWRTDYNCFTSSGVSGGVQATAALGKHSLSGLVYIPFARTPSRSGGVLAAFDKATGEVVWEFSNAAYSWSSPVCVYDAEGRGYVVYCNSAGYMYLIDGLTGERLDVVHIGGNIEASPAVYNSTVVVGTRDQRIWGVELT